MTQRLRNRLIETLHAFRCSAAAGAAVMPRAHADMIATDEAQAPTEASSERERVKALLERPEVAQAAGEDGRDAARTPRRAWTR